MGLKDSELRAWLRSPGEPYETSEGSLQIRFLRTQISFRARGTLHGRRQTFAIGRFEPDPATRVVKIPADLARSTPMGIALARRYANHLSNLCESGVDPKCRRATEEVQTFKDLIERYIAGPAQNLKDGREIARSLRLIPEAMQAKAPDDLTTGEVEDYLKSEIHRIKKKGGHGGAIANKLKAYISGCFSWGRKHRYTNNTPTVGIKRFRAKRPKRGLTDDEIRKIWNACCQHRDERRGPGPKTSVAGPFLQLRLLTGARERDLVERQWADLRKGPLTHDEVANPETAESAWLHVAQTKSEEPHQIFLGAFAMEVIRDLYARGSDWVVPGADPAQHLSRIYTAVLSIERKAGIPHWIPRDLRAATASGMIRCGILPAIVSVCLRHADGFRQGQAAAVTEDYYVDASAYHPHTKLAWETWQQRVQEIVSSADDSRN